MNFFHSELSIKAEGSSEQEPCSDCGNRTRSAWGYVYCSDDPLAVYFARFTPGHKERGADILLSTGGWGQSNEQNNDRRSFGVQCRIVEDRPAFMLVDAETLPWSKEEVLGRQLTREQALLDEAKESIFTILDQLIEQDDQLRAFLN